MFRVVLTKYVPGVQVIYIDSVMKAFSSYDATVETVNKFIEATTIDLEAVYNKPENNINFVTDFPNHPDSHYAIIKMIAGSDNKKNETPVLLIDIFEIEKNEDLLKYRDDFVIKSVKDGEFDYYEVLLNDNVISIKENVPEALLFIDNFIHSHTICQAINGHMDINMS